MAVHTMNKELINEAKKHLISIKYDNLNPIIKNFTNAEELCLLGGRPAMGKTSFSLNIAAKMLKQGKRVVIISLESMAYQIVGKLIPLFMENDNDFDNDVNQIISSGLIIDDTSLIDVDDLFNKEYVNQIKTGNNCSNLYYHNSLYYDLNKDPFYK